MDARNTSTSFDQEFVITRNFDAPRERVWQAWTEREQLMQWFGPQGFAMTHAVLDLRLGGHFHYALRSPHGQEMWGKRTFAEITAPQRLVLVSLFSAAKGGITRHPISPNWPRETLSTTTFAEHAGKTVVTIRWTPWNASGLECKTFAESH